MNREGRTLSIIQTKTFLIFLAACSYSLPFLLGGPQSLVGTAVNAALVLSVLIKQDGYFWPVILLPSLGVLSRGFLFGPLTPFLVYLVPFIWAGNFIFVSVVKRFYRQNNFFPLLLAALVKAGFLFSIAFLFNRLGLLPPLFLKTMGVFQFATALAGGLTAFAIFKNLFLEK